MSVDNNLPQENATLATTASAILLGTLSRLSPALEILEGFHQRHKNQHRLSRWWAQYDMLRRQVRRLELDVNTRLDQVERQEAAAARRAAKTRKKAKKRDGEVIDQDASVADGVGPLVVIRATHVRENLVPRAFLAFSQLITEKQFAHLGLVVLGALSQIDGALQALAPSERDEPEGEAGERAEEPPKTRRVPVAVASNSDELDFGVAISREELAASRGSEQTRPKAATAALDEENPVLTEPQSPGSNGDASIAREVKGSKKAKKRKQDEFDSIFSSLGPIDPQKKKKKKRKRDEFDDLFGSLT